MRKFIGGIIFAVVAFIIAMFIYARAGYMAVSADASPGAVETWVASKAFDASVDRHAPKVQNPIQASDDNLNQGMIVYTMNCAVCHGSPARRGQTVGQSEYPPAPQFTHDPPDMPDYQNYWIIRHGVRYTAMPAWEKVLSDDEIWKVTTFLAHWKNLPPAVKAKFESQQ